MPVTRRPTRRCANCGYLAKLLDGGFTRGEYEPTFTEIHLSPRQDPQQAQESITTFFRCYRGAFDLHGEQLDEMTSTKCGWAEAYAAVVQKQRDCRFFTRYVPGYSPALHLDKEERRANRWWELFVALAGAVVGGVIAILTVLAT